MRQKVRIRYKRLIFLVGCSLFFTSCEEDLTLQNGSKKDVNFPSQTITNANIIQRDSGFVKLRAKVPLIEKYELIDSPYIVARKGIDIQFFDKKKPKTPGTIKADYAKFHELKKFYEAKGHVQIRTNEGQRFAMKTVFWDQIKKEIYTKDTVFVTDKDGSVLIGANGMWAKDDFSEYTFYNNSGDKSIPETAQ